MFAATTIRRPATRAAIGSSHDRFFSTCSLPTRRAEANENTIRSPSMSTRCACATVIL